jgi:phosphatidylglycerol:prolipoprotein diacylglycerol transferase
MYPTLFRVPFLPDAWGDIKSYGAMMMVAFLGGIWLACRRALRVKADPDVVLNMGFIALIAGIVGARLFYVIHYWETRFANQPNPLLAAFDIRAGGLEFWGGPLLVIPCLMFYLWRGRHSIRWYLDITAPSLMFGLAIARIGCFLNGCCWGSVCVDTHDPALRPDVPWAVRYPYGSPAMIQQFNFGQLTLPKELIYFLPTGQALPLPREIVMADREAIDGPARDLRLAEEELRGAERLGRDVKQIAKIRARIGKHAKRAEIASIRFLPLRQQCERYGLMPSDLRDLARHYASQPSHPAQLYGFINGMALYWLLHTMFYWRRRHGILLGWMLVFYSISRILLEAIRQDNPLDVGGLTISQFVSLLTLLVGVVWLLYMRRLPLRSPLAVPVEFDEPPDTKQA